MNNREINKKKYLYVFMISITIFLTAFLLSTKIQDQRMEKLDDIESTIVIDTMSSDVQFALLGEASCKNVNEQTTLSTELKDLARRLTFMEGNIQEKPKEFIDLKKRYTLLQIKDYLLMKELAKKCNLKPINILYFYSNKENECVDCQKQGYVLTRLSRDNPRLRVYAFDYDLDLGALKTLIDLYSVDGKKLPVLIIEGKKYVGFKDLDDIRKLLPKLEIIEEKYLEQSDGSKSKIQVQCSEDKQCEINDKLEYRCGIPVAINKENRLEDILEYNKIEDKIQEEININCNSIIEENREAYCDLEENSCLIRKSGK
jgi:hypothetical protein